MKASFCKFISGISFFSLALFSSGVFAADTLTDSATGETFPSTVSFDHAGKKYQLNATGVATRKKLFVKVYSLAHYLQDGAAVNKANAFSTILSDDYAKQATMKWVRDIPAGKIQEGYEESFKAAFPEPKHTQLKNEIDTYISFFNHDMKKGDEYDVRWLPGGYVEVIINGTSAGSVQDKDFAKGLWEIWFGSKSVVNRDDLISLIK